MSDGLAERTQAPTVARRRHARSRGQIARSRDLSSAVLLLSIAVTLAWLGPDFARALEQQLQQHLANAGISASTDGGMDFGPASAARAIRDAFAQAAARAAPLVLTVWAAVLLLNVVQNGFLLRPAHALPRLSRIHPLQGFRHIVSLANAWRSGLNLLKVVLVAGVAGWVIWQQLPDSVHLARGIERDETLADQPLGPVESVHDPADRGRIVAQYLGNRIKWMAWALALVICGVAMLDYAFQRWKHEQDLKMTRQEVREELRQNEGDPEQRRRRRERQRELATGPTPARIEDADVLLFAPTGSAIALRYDERRTSAPVASAAGTGDRAEEMKRRARHAGVPILERPELVQQLIEQTAVGAAVPRELYPEVAEAMACVRRNTGDR